MKTERWLPVPDYPNYEASDLGRIRRAQPARNSWAGRVLKASIRNGYPSVDLSHDGVRQTMSVHRLIAAAFIGPCPPGQEVNHVDGTKTNNRPANLEYISSSANQKHAYQRGLQVVTGERNGQAKLTEDHARAILARAPFHRGDPARLAREFGVSDSTIRDLIRGRTWGHLHG